MWVSVNTRKADLPVCSCIFSELPDWRCLLCSSVAERNWSINLIRGRTPFFYPNLRGAPSSNECRDLPWGKTALIMISDSNTSSVFPFELLQCFPLLFSLSLWILKVYLKKYICTSSYLKKYICTSSNMQELSCRSLLGQATQCSILLWRCAGADTKGNSGTNGVCPAVSQW